MHSEDLQGLRDHTATRRLGLPGQSGLTSCSGGLGERPRCGAPLYLLARATRGSPREDLNEAAGTPNPKHGLGQRITGAAGEGVCGTGSSGQEIRRAGRAGSWLRQWSGQCCLSQPFFYFSPLFFILLFLIIYFKIMSNFKKHCQTEHNFRVSSPRSPLWTLAASAPRAPAPASITSSPHALPPPGNVSESSLSPSASSVAPPFAYLLSAANHTGSVCIPPSLPLPSCSVTPLLSAVPRPQASPPSTGGSGGAGERGLDEMTVSHPGGRCTQAKGSELQAGCGLREDEGPAGAWTAACTEDGGRGQQEQPGGARDQVWPPGSSQGARRHQEPGHQGTLRSAPAVACEPGSYFSGDPGQCVPCAPGTYQDGEGQLSCTPCPSRDGLGLAGARNVSECGGKCGPSWEGEGGEQRTQSLGQKGTSRPAGHARDTPSCLARCCPRRDLGPPPAQAKAVSALS